MAMHDDVVHDALAKELLMFIVGVPVTVGPLAND
jgi:hypothetical protein